MTERTIVLDRKRVIRFTKNSCILAENLMNVNFPDWPIDFGAIVAYVTDPPPTIDKATLFLWIALLDDDPKLTLYELRRMVTELAGSKDVRRLRARLALGRVPFLCAAALEQYRREAA